MVNNKKEIQFWQTPQTVANISDLLEKNQVILSSTDTVLGLLAPVTRQGFELLDSIKQRSKKPYLVLIGSAEFLTEFIDPISDFHIENLIKNCWPGPLTLIFKAKASLPEFIKGAQGTIALRVPDHAQLRQLATQFHGLFSTSANIAHQPVPTRMAAVDPEILSVVAAWVDDANHENVDCASTILDCSAGTISVVRPGAYPIEVLENQAGVKFS